MSEELKAYRQKFKDFSHDDLVKEIISSHNSFIIEKQKLKSVISAIGVPGSNGKAAVREICKTILQNPTGNIKRDLESLKGAIGESGSTLQDDVTSIMLGSSEKSTKLSDLSSKILKEPTTNVTTDLDTARKKLVPETDLGNTLEDSIGAVNTAIGGTGTTTKEQITSIIGKIKTGSSDVQAALNVVSNKLVGNSNFSKSLDTIVNTMNTSLDGSVLSLPGGATYITVNNFTKETNAIILTSGDRTYTTVFSNQIGVGGEIIFIDEGNSLSLKNTGAVINTADQLLTYLKSMYPTTSKISLNLTDSIGSIKAMINNSKDIKPAISELIRSVSKNPTGGLFNDLNTARQGLVDSPDANLETDIENIKTKLGGIGAVSSMIGSPMNNNSTSSIRSIIGGDANESIAYNLGDPRSGGGVFGKINAVSVNTSNTIFRGAKLNEFKNAADLNDQLDKFIALFNNGNWTTSGHTRITFNFGSGAPASLADIINAASGTSPW